MTKRLSAIALGLLVACAVDACGASDSGTQDHRDAAGGAGGSAGTATDGGGDASDSGGGPGCNTTDPGATPVTCVDPDPGATPALDGAVFAVTYIYADEQRDKTKDPTNVWKTIGFDIDGQNTNASSPDHCIPVSGADATSVKTDGDNGIDNGFLKNVAPIIAGVDSTWAENWNTGLAQGSSTILIYLPGLALPPAADGGGTTPMPARGYTSVALCTGPTTEGGAEAGVEGGVEGGADAAVPPRRLAVDRASVCDGDLAQPLWSAPDGTLDGDVWTSGIVPQATLAIPFKGSLLYVHLRAVHLEMTLSADRRSVSMGTLGGVVDTQQLIDEMNRIKGAILPGLCGALASVFNGYMDRVRKASDILSDGSQDPKKTCDGISAGLGFDAEVVQVRGLASTPPATDTCADH